MQELTENKKPEVKTLWLTSKEYAEQHNLKYDKLTRLCRLGRVPDAKKIEGRWYFPVEVPTSEYLDRLDKLENRNELTDDQMEALKLTGYLLAQVGEILTKRDAKLSPFMKMISNEMKV